MEENEREEILRILQKCENAQLTFANRTQQSISTVEQLASAYDRISVAVKAIAGISLVKIFKDALDYAKQFDKAITDMAVVTQQSIASARELGDT